MFSRVNNRNTGYSENLFSQNSRVENNTLASIDGANALKLDESYQLEEDDLNTPVDSVESQPDKQVFNQTLIKSEQANDNLPTGLSIESAAYMENSNLVDNVDTSSSFEKGKIDDEYTPKLFSDEQNYQTEETELEANNQKNNEPDELFDQDINEEDDFEIPAFLRKQKF